MIVKKELTLTEIRDILWLHFHDANDVPRMPKDAKITVIVDVEETMIQAKWEE